MVLHVLQKLAAMPCAYCSKSPLEYQAPALAGPQATGQGKEHVVGVVLLCPLVVICCSIIPHTLLAHQTRPTPKSHPEAACSGWGNEEDLLRWMGGLGHGGFGLSSPQQATLDAGRGGDNGTMARDGKSLELQDLAEACRNPGRSQTPFAISLTWNLCSPSLLRQSQCYCKAIEWQSSAENISFLGTREMRNQDVTPVNQLSLEKLHF